MWFPEEMAMAGNKQPNEDPGLENLSVNSSRRSGVKEDGTGNPAHQDGKHNPTESAKVPDQQIPMEQSPGIEDTEGHPTWSHSQFQKLNRLLLAVKPDGWRSSSRESGGYTLVVKD
jgi:hypothetical protein